MLFPTVISALSLLKEVKFIKTTIIKHQFVFLLVSMIIAPLTAQTLTNENTISVSPNIFTSATDFPATSNSGFHSSTINDDIKFIKEKTLWFDASFGAPTSPGGDQSNGVRFYSFNMKPKEKIFFKMKSENANQIGMQLLKPGKPDKMLLEYARLSRMPKSLRSSQMEVKNITDDNYTIVLFVYGSVSYWYEIEIIRSI